MYIVTSKPKRISVYSGLVHMANLLNFLSGKGGVGIYDGPIVAQPWLRL